MADLNFYEKRRDALKLRYLSETDSLAQPVRTAGVDHLALISSNLEATIDFYTRLLGMHLTRIVQNRDEPTSTHIFLDMGGGNQLAFFDFPEAASTHTVRGVGSMHHVAIKATPAQMREIISALDAAGIRYSAHGSPESGSIYVRDPDDILVEITTGY
jgi:catechol 2,3-dioxygenase-like lactoylglutathione lyase family enzyme